MKNNIYDIIVIGAGSAGLGVSLPMNELGFKVLLIDKGDRRIGGECLNDGCVPSKALIHVAKIIHEAKKSTDFGLSVSGELDFQKVKDYIKNVQNTIKEHENAKFLSEIGLDVELGTARFTGERSIEVNGKEYSAKKIVLATGSKPRMIKAKGIENVKVFTNENIFDIEDLPRKLVIIGGGPIGMEFSQAFRRLGSEVHVIETGEQILSKEDPSISKILKDILEKEGVNFHLNSNILEFTSPSSILFTNENKEKISLEFDAVLIGVGREVSFEGLDLEKAGIKTNEKGLPEINNYLKTTNRNVLIAGDAAGSLNFSHAAELHATVIIKNFINPLQKKVKYDHFSWVTFTDPEIATFGLNEHALKEQSIDFERLEYDLADDDRAVIGSYRYGKLILFVERSIIPGGDKKIYGGSMIAPNAGEIIQELVLANSAGLGTKALFEKIHAYPVASRVNKSIILEKTRKEVGPFVKKIIRSFY